MFIFILNKKKLFIQICRLNEIQHKLHIRYNWNDDFENKFAISS